MTHTKNMPTSGVLGLKDLDIGIKPRKNAKLNTLNKRKNMPSSGILGIKTLFSNVNLKNIKYEKYENTK